MTCEFCQSDGGEVLFRNAALRVVRVGGREGDVFPGYCRVVWNEHVKELTDLAPAARDGLMRMVFSVEAALRLSLNPDKVNVASLGNLTPHLHWHVVPRFHDDAAYPRPVWGVDIAEAPARCAESVEPDWVTVVRRAAAEVSM